MNKIKLKPVKEMVRNSVWNSVDDSVDDSVDNSVDNSVRRSVRNFVIYSVWDSVYMNLVNFMEKWQEIDAGNTGVPQRNFVGKDILDLSIKT